MAHRINERNLGSVTIESTPKRAAKKITNLEWDLLLKIASTVYDAMEEDEATNTYTDGGRIVISLSGEEMYDLFEAKRKISGIVENI
jgi:hypothetical protein